MLHSYPWYIADWRSAEAVLAMTLEERGLYRELLDHCWECGSIPNNEVVLRKIAQVTEKEWIRSWPAVKPQFLSDGDRLRHRKVDEKREDLVAWHDNRREAGRKGGLSKKTSSASSSASSSAQAKPKPSTASSTASSTTDKLAPRAVDIDRTTRAVSSLAREDVQHMPHGEFPEVGRAVREKFPEASDSVIMQITIAVGQKIAGANGHVKGELTDALMADAVRHCAKAWPDQKSPHGYVKTVAQCVLTWLTQGKPKPPAQEKKAKYEDYFPTGTDTPSR